MAPDELEHARLGFNQYPRGKGFSPQFIDRNGDELFATAALEYSRKLAEGEEIESPAASKGDTLGNPPIRRSLGIEP